MEHCPDCGTPLLDNVTECWECERIVCDDCLNSQGLCLSCLTEEEDEDE